MRLKKLLFMMVLLTIAGRASSQVSFSVDPFSINAGETKNVDINVSITGTYLACQFELLLPEGLSILSDEYGYYADFKPVNSRAEDHGLAVSNPSTNLYRFVISSNNNKTFVTGSNRSFVSLTLVADAKASSGTNAAKIQNALFSISNTQGEGADDLEFNITVAGKPTVTADNKSREYGEENPEFTYTVSGGTITEPPTLSTTANATSNVGEYPITVAANDAYNTAPGTLTVTKAPLTINGGTYSIKQGDALPAFAAVYTGFKNNETSAVLTSQPVLTLEDGVTGASAPGSYTITVSGGEATNYAITRENGTLTITAADPVTVTAKSYTITYGDALPDFSYTTEGAALSGVPEISCTATAASGVGTYPITITKGTVSNYNVTYVNGTLTIKPAALTITAKDKEKTYGDANPTLGYACKGFVKGENESVITTVPTVSTTADATSNVGTYDITASGAVAANYEISYAKGTLTIKKATLTAKAKDASVKQGEVTPALEIEYSGWKNSDGVTALTTAPTASTERTLASEPGSYPITVAGGEDDNYDFTYVPGTLIVTEADPVTVTAKSYTIKYGDDIPNFEYTSTGAALNGTPTMTCEATKTSTVGTYTINIAKGSVTNYNATFVPGTLKIEQAPLTAKAKDVIVEQGVATPTLEIEYTGFKNNETEDVLTTKPTAATTREVSSNPGTYPITLTGGSATNYAITLEDGTLTVTLPGLITVTVTNAERYYGAENPTFAYTVTGGTLTGEPVLSCTATKTSAVGEYDITIEKGTISNYNVSLVGGKLNVKNAPLTITPENKQKKYGEDNPTLTYTCSGFVNDETSAVLTTQPTLNTEATATSGVGTYEITASGAVAANYEISYAKGTLTINKATLTAKAKDASVKQGEVTPAFEIEYSGWKNSDGVTALTTAPTASTERTLASEPGSYPITVAGGEDDNYDFTYVPGTLIVTEADPVTVTAKSYTIKYGDDIPNFEYTSTGAALNGTPTMTCEATKTSTVGTYTINIAKGSVTNYNATFVPGTLKIEQAPLTAKAKDVIVEQGVATPTLEIEYTGFKNNETEEVLTTKPTAATTREVSSNPGTYPITLTGGSATNYAITLENGTLTVTQPGLITVIVTNTERNYGDENPTFQYTVTGGELAGEPELNCTATKTSVPGEYDITIGMGTITNYNVSLVGGKLTVKKAPLTITADNKSKTYGEANPTLTYTCSGLKNDETEDVLTTVPTLSTTADATSNVGKYDITAEGAVAANYEISYTKGTLTVNPMTIALSISLTPYPASYTYDGNVKQPTVSVSATGISSLTASVDYTLSGTQSATIAGEYTITATPSGNYTGSAVSADWSITPKTSTDTDGNTIVEDGVNVTLSAIGNDAVGEDGTLNIPDNVTQIADNAFAGMTGADKASVKCIDLRNSNVTGLTVDRESGVFKDFSESTLICLPTGNNDGGEANVVIGSTCNELKLTDGIEATIPFDFTANKVTYTRALTANDVSTTCLPYSLSSNSDVTFYELSDAKSTTLIFNQVATTEPNKPYLVVPNTANASLGKQVSTSISSGNADETGITGYKMIGTKTRINRDDALGFFILQDNNEWKPITTASPATVYIPAYRGYIAGGASARLLYELNETDGTTRIRSIQTVDADGSEKWYDMNGRRLLGKPVGTGAYIVNGKKVIIKK